jgi:hypothetical protein
MSLLVALQYCDKDVEQCQELAKILARLAPSNPGLGILFWREPGVAAPNPQVVKDLAAHYQVFSLESPACARGWPDGPNEMWQWLAKSLTDTAFCPGFDQVLTTEPDSVPLRHDWSVELLAFHEAAVARGATFTGHVCVSPGRHINGNLMMRRDAAVLLPGLLKRLPKGKAWDYEYRAMILGQGEDNPWLMSDYKSHRKDSLALWSHDKGQGLCGWLHGVKGWHGLDECQRRLFGTSWEVPRILHQVDLSPEPNQEALAKVRMLHPTSDGWLHRLHGPSELEAWPALKTLPLVRQTQALAARILLRDGGWYVATDIETVTPLVTAEAALPGAGFLAFRRGDAVSCQVLGAAAGHPDLARIIASSEMSVAMDKERGLTWMPQGWFKQSQSVTACPEVAAADIPRFVLVARDDEGGWKAVGASLSKHTLGPLTQHYREVLKTPTLLLRVVRAV